MKIETIQYQKTFNLGNYSNEKIGVEIKVGDGEDPLDAFAEAKKLVEKSHKFFQEMPYYERAKRMVDNPDDHLGKDVKAAKEVVAAFENNYPDFVSRFMPVSRQITQGVSGEDNY